jgi:hypothetical protein
MIENYHLIIVGSVLALFGLAWGLCLLVSGDEAEIEKPVEDKSSGKHDSRNF